MIRCQRFEVGERADRKGCFFSLSKQATFLMIAGAVGITASFALVVALLINVLSLAVVCALIVYGVGVVAMAILTPAYGDHWSKWPVRLVAPLPGAALVWLALRAIGF